MPEKGSWNILTASILVKIKLTLNKTARTIKTFNSFMVSILTSIGVFVSNKSFVVAFKNVEGPDLVGCDRGTAGR